MVHTVFVKYWSWSEHQCPILSSVPYSVAAVEGGLLVWWRVDCCCGGRGLPQCVYVERRGAWLGLYLTLWAAHRRHKDSAQAASRQQTEDGGRPWSAVVSPHSNLRIGVTKMAEGGLWLSKRIKKYNFVKKILFCLHIFRIIGRLQLFITNIFFQHKLDLL